MYLGIRTVSIGLALIVAILSVVCFLCSKPKYVAAPVPDTSSLLTTEYNLGYAEGVHDGMSLFNEMYVSNGFIELPKFNNKWMQLPDLIMSTNRISINKL